MLRYFCGVDDHHEDSPTPPVSLLVPFYVWPNADTYDRLAAAGPAAIAIITGPNNGPPVTSDPNTSVYQQLFRQLAAAGVQLVGYVPMDYGRRPQQQTLRDVAAWYDGYGDCIQGIFVDEANSEVTSASQSYYAALRQALNSRGNGQLLVLNPGTAMEPPLAKQADIVVTFEDPFNNWRKEKASSQRGHISGTAMNAAAGPKSATLVHGTGKLSPAALQAQMSRASRLGYSYVYFTDADVPNPWDRLPSYWDCEIKGAAKH